MQKWPKIIFFKTFIKTNSCFGENNVHSVIASFCLFFRAFSQINSSASWPTVGGDPMLTALLLRVKVAQALKAFDKTQMNGDKAVCVRSGGSEVADTGARI